jgi:saposin
MKILLGALCALLSVVFVSSFPTPHHSVPAECADPTFACQDLQSARLCQVVKSCIHDVWATMTVPDNDNDEVCDICKEMVKEARDQLLSNMTQEEIKEVFEGSCKLLPVKIIAEGCIKIVDEIIPELVEMLASRMDPTMVCTVSGMCFASRNGPSAENHLFNFFKSLVISHNDDQCSECTKMLTDVQAFLKSTPEDDVKKYLETFCHEKMPSYLCNIVINSYFPEIYKFIQSSTPAELCSSVGICPKQKCELRKSSESKVNDELTCEFCYHLVEHVKDLITANTTVEEFKGALLNFCNITGSFSERCTKLVNDYYDMLFNYIRQIDSKGMCTLMGLCNNDSCSRIPLVKVFPALEVGRKVPLIKLRPAERVPNYDPVPIVRLIPEGVLSKKGHDDSNDIFQSRLIPIERISRPQLVFQKDTECALCKAFAFFLEKDLAGDRSKAGVRQAISAVCERGMVEYSEECTRIVARYSVKIQMAVAKGVSYDELCPLIKACPLQDETSGGLKVRVISGGKDSPFCDLCKDAMNEVEKQLSDPATKEKLENLFGQFCSYLPQSLRSDCTNFINSNIDALIDILEQELKPNTVCPALGLCPGSMMSPVPVRVKDLECDVCKDVVASFRQKLENPESKVIVQTFLEEACIRLPSSLAAECKDFVDKNIDFILNILIQEVDPQTVCSFLSICPDSIKKPEPVNDVECDLCEQVVTQVLDMVKDKKTEDEIKSALERVCSYLPSSMSAKCKNFVDTYTDLLISLITQELTPQEVCQELGLCQATIKKPEPVNDLECDLCDQVVTQVLNMVQDQKTEEAIKEALDKVCDYLPSSWEAKCQNFVNTYTDILISLLTQEITAQEVCQALKLCPETIKKPEPVNDMECDLCKQVATQLINMIKDPKTEDQIKQALDTVCSYLPSSIATKCENFVNKYTDTLITILSEEVTPEMVCAALNVCPASEKKVKDMECDLCKQVIGQIEDLIKDNNTEAGIQAALDKVCSLLPSSISAKCVNFVNKYTQTIVTLLMEELDPDMVCAALNVCPGSVQKVKIEVKDAECEVCKKVAETLVSLVKDEKTEAAIKGALETVCRYLPGSMSAKCKDFVDEYTDLLIQMIIEEIPPEQICAALNMCPSYTVKRVKTAKVKDIECDLCKEAIGKIEDMIKDSKTEAEIKDALDAMCRILPKSMAAKCENFVNQYTVTLITLLTMELDPSMVCAELKVCPAQDMECQSCQYALHFVQEQLMNPDTQGEVKNLLKQVCSLIPETYGQNCEAFIDEYGSSLLTLIAQEIDPTTMCFQLKMCSNQTSLIMQKVPQVPLAPFKSDECSVCTTVVDYLGKLLEEDDVDKEITKLVEKVCTVVPASFKAKCSTTIETYGPYLLEMLGQLTDSKLICQDIDMCARSPHQVHLLGGSKCTFGPSYWCQSSAHAAACKAEMYCSTYVTK